MKYKKSVIILILIFTAPIFAFPQNKQAVQIWEEPLVIPTYLTNPPDVNPMFFQNQSYQGASVDGRLINSTEDIHSMLYWANVATHVNNDYQVIFPPSTNFAVFHAKNSFSHWPITHEAYVGHEYYKNNIDASWWKNHPNPVSFFAYDLKEGFLAGYDYGKHAGTMHVANPNIVKGAKLWEWGPGAYGAMWDSKVLTDSNGPYAELMAGAYSDNQPDYSWIKPYELKTFKQFWYPLHETEGAVTANTQGMLNLKKINNDTFLIAANTSEEIAVATIKLQKENQVIFEKKIDISPAKPFLQKIEYSGNPADGHLQLSLSDKNKNEIISYTPQVKNNDLHDIYVDACLLRGDEFFRKGDYDKALEDFLIADKYPENQQIGREDNYQRQVQIFCLTAQAYQKLGNKNKAKEYYNQAATLNVRNREYSFYKALALEETGKKWKAEKLLDDLINQGEKMVDSSNETDFFSKFGSGQSGRLQKPDGYYLTGLGFLGKGKKQKAREFMAKATELNPNHIWAQNFLVSLGN